MSQSDVARWLTALGPAVTFIGVAITLWSHHLWRIRIRDWWRRVLDLFGKDQIVAVGTATEREDVMSATGTVTGPWNDDWTAEEKFQELIRRINDVQKTISSHEHPAIDERLNRLNEADTRLSETVDQMLRDLRDEGQKSDRIAIGGLSFAGVGAALSVVGVLL